MSIRRVVITAMGTLSPIGNSVTETWNAALNGQSGIGPITRFDVTNFATRIAGELKGFDPVKYMEAKEVKKLDLFSQFAMGAAEEAWQTSNLATANYDKSKMGCILGIGVGGLGTLEKYHGAYVEGGPRKISPFLIPAMISNLGPGNIAIKYDLRGVNYAITSACTSATHAIGEAFRLIRDGLQDCVLAGGTEAAITPIGVGGFCSMKAMSTRNDEPTKASRPFDKDRDGFVMGEGAALLVIEELEAATKRGAQILAEVKGYGFSCDAYHITSPSPEGAGAYSCMKMAIDMSKLQLEQIQYVNAHGTSTEFNDAAETQAIKKIFGDWSKDGLLVSSTKSMTGHLLGAGGAIEAIFCTKVINEGIIPPTINLDNPSEGCDLDYIPHKAREAKVVNTISNSFGFGGTNASIVIGAL